MKGEILSRAASAKVLDLSHQVPRHSVKSGAFLLHCAIDSFPKKTIFLSVVDPGVGSERRSLVGYVGDYGFVGPDNGLVTPLLDRSGGQSQLHEIKSPIFRNPVISRTFHGRDIFAPAAARLHLGDDPRMAGPRVEEPLTIPFLDTKRENGTLTGEVMLIDHFGNAVTNLSREELAEGGKKPNFKLQVRNLELDKIIGSYSDQVDDGALCYWGSSGYLEVAVNFGSAAEAYGIKIGDPVEVTLS